MGLTAYIVAVLKGERKHREALLCGVFAMIVGTAISSVGVDVGFIGSLSASIEGNLSIIYFYVKSPTNGGLGPAP